ISCVAVLKGVVQKVIVRMRTPKTRLTAGPAKNTRILFQGETWLSMFVSKSFSFLVLLESSGASLSGGNISTKPPIGNAFIPYSAFLNFFENNVGPKPIKKRGTLSPNLRATIMWPASRSEERRVGKEC